jgi:hypothetical protein
LPVSHASKKARATSEIGAVVTSLIRSSSLVKRDLA